MDPCRIVCGSSVNLPDNAQKLFGEMAIILDRANVLEDDVFDRAFRRAGASGDCRLLDRQNVRLIEANGLRIETILTTEGDEVTGVRIEQIASRSLGAALGCDDVNLGDGDTPLDHEGIERFGDDLRRVTEHGHEDMTGAARSR
jgi:hypothetical protein